MCGNQKPAQIIALRLAADLGPRGIDAEPLVNAQAVTALTSVLISINMRSEVPVSDIHITGLPEAKPLLQCTHYQVSPKYTPETIARH